MGLIKDAEMVNISGNESDLQSTHEFSHTTQQFTVARVVEMSRYEMS